MRDYFLIFLLMWFSLFSLHSTAVEYVPTPEFIRKNGYPAESHQIVSQDGYILTLHRIPYSSKSPAASNKRVVFLQHGLCGSSMDWVLMGPENSLGYLLADIGYDVWLGNSRGNTYSTNHTTLSTRSRKYWDFSWHEMGVHDIPAVIDYILNATEEESIYYIGMSMGTTIFFVFASERPEYNDKIRLMIAEAPVAFMDKMTSPIAVSQISSFVLRLLQSLDIHGIKKGKIYDALANYVCGHEILGVICSNLIFSLQGFDAKQFNESMLPLFSTYYPDGISVKCLKHYYQLIKSGTFRQYDYGDKLNMMKYKQPKPPQYNINNITARIALMYATNDGLSSAENVLQLNRILPNCVEMYKVPHSAFNHVDYLIGIDVKTLVNDEVINIMKKY